MKNHEKIWCSTQTPFLRSTPLPAPRRESPWRRQADAAGLDPTLSMVNGLMGAAARVGEVNLCVRALISVGFALLGRFFFLVIFGFVWYFYLKIVFFLFLCAF